MLFVVAGTLSGSSPIGLEQHVTALQPVILMAAVRFKRPELLTKKGTTIYSFNIEEPWLADIMNS